MKEYKTAMYERLSRDDGEDVSESISTQKLMLEQYCNDTACLLPVKHYTDDGYTGVSFNRPAFREMYDDIINGFIDCVVVKDLSRFGRDYISMGEYLERIFPKLGIRFIATNDGIDSDQGEYSMMLPLANLFNSQYAKDISVKVRNAILIKQRAGCFTGAYAPYGYKKDGSDHNRLVVDEPSANVVKRIFQMYMSGMGKTAIASELNKAKVLAPKAYKNSSNAPWSLYTVNRILADPIYHGNMPVGKTVRRGLHGNKHKNAASELVENTHEAIINDDIWLAVKNKLAENKRASYRRSSNSTALFSGIVYCAQCGGKMMPVNSHGKSVYFCRRYRTCGPAACGSQHISQETLYEIVLRDINAQLKQTVNIKEMCARAESENAIAEQKKRKELASKINGLYSEKQRAYEKYKSGALEKNDYLNKKNDLDNIISACEKGRKEGQKSMSWVKRFVNINELAQLEKSDVNSLIERIVVDRLGNIEIWYKWRV